VVLEIGQREEILVVVLIRARVRSGELLVERRLTLFLDRLVNDDFGLLLIFHI
jgi:hypothetical protein